MRASDVDPLLVGAGGSLDTVLAWLGVTAYGGGSAVFEEPGAGTEEDRAEYIAQRERDAKEAGRRANQEKVRGFYVDVDTTTGDVLSPASIDAGTVAEYLQTAAQVVERLLIKDHSRMKFDAATPYDATHAQQHRLLPIAHPEDWEAASEEFKSGSYFRPTDSD